MELYTYLLGKPSVALPDRRKFKASYLTRLLHKHLRSMRWSS